MKTVALVAALTGSCAVIYLLYRYNMKSKEKRLHSKNLKNLQSDLCDKGQEQKHSSSKGQDQNHSSSKSQEQNYSSFESMKTKAICSPTNSVSDSQELSGTKSVEGSCELLQNTLIIEAEVSTSIPNTDHKSEDESNSEVIRPTADIATTSKLLEANVVIDSSGKCGDEEETILPSEKNNVLSCTSIVHNDIEILPTSSDFPNESMECKSLEMDVELLVQTSVKIETNSQSSKDVPENLYSECDIVSKEDSINKVHRDISSTVQSEENLSELKDITKHSEITPISETLTNISENKIEEVNVDSAVTLSETPTQSQTKSKRRRKKNRASQMKTIATIQEVEISDSPKSLNSENENQENLLNTDNQSRFWEVKEATEVLKNKTETIENNNNNLKSSHLEPSPDHICTSDLERESSLTPEQEIVTSDSLSLISQASLDSGHSSIDHEAMMMNIIYPDVNSEYYITFQFEVPQVLVGKLIGRRGVFLNKLKAATSTNIVVVDHEDEKYKICSIEGKKWQVSQALDMIRDHFPVERFPELNLTQINTPSVSPLHQPQMNRQFLQVELPPGVVLEVQTSAVISTGEVWLQQPLHPTYSALEPLHQCLNINYGDGSSTPALPTPIPPNTICVCQAGDQWFRCQVMDHDDTQCTVCLLDVGGHINLPISLLRQIRVNYISLPFQATECFLYGIEPCSENGWEEEGRLELLQLTKSNLIYATIAAYSEEGIPLVNLYQRQFNQYTYINEKLVEMGHAKWISSEGAPDESA